MGIQVVTTDGTCDYIAAPRVIRTMKFLRALAHGAEVINSSFVDECLETGQLARIEDHPLNDGENEERFGVCLQQAVARARKNNGKLLWKVPIYCTQDINNGIDSFRPIAEANGAIFKPYSARSGTTIRPTTAEEDAGSPPEPVYLLSSTSPIEKKLWPKFEEMARKGNMEPRVVSADWLLNVAMTQELSFDSSYLLTDHLKDGEDGEKA